MTRSEQDHFNGDSNGMPMKHCRTRPTKGIPVTVRLTTHTDVWIEEDYFVEFDPKNPTVVREPLSDIRMLSVRAEPVRTDKIILVDFKRPAAGMLDTSMDFNDDQFFKKVQSSIEDDTINESAKLLKTVISLVTPKSTGVTDEPAADNVNRKKLRRVVAYQRFDVNEPDYETQLDGFISRHLNSCNQCGLQPSYDQQGQALTMQAGQNHPS
jgi:hypothetical protein